MVEILNIEVSVSLLQAATFIILVSFCLLFNRTTLGLLLAFVFVFNWATFANREIILEVLQDNRYYWAVYLGGGALLACLAGLGVMATEREFKVPKRKKRAPRKVYLGAEEVDDVLDLTGEWEAIRARG